MIWRVLSLARVIGARICGYRLGRLWETAIWHAWQLLCRTSHIVYFKNLAISFNYELHVLFRRYSGRLVSVCSRNPRSWRRGYTRRNSLPLIASDEFMSSAQERVNLKKKLGNILEILTGATVCFKIPRRLDIFYHHYNNLTVA